MKTAGKIIGIIVGALVMFFFGLTVGMMPHQTTTVAQPAPIVAAAPAQPAPAPATTQAGVTHPMIGFSDGTYEVGTGDGQILPGKYKVGPAEGGMGNYYSITRGGTIVKNDYTHGPTFMTVKAGDTVTISGGGQWVQSQ